MAEPPRCTCPRDPDDENDPGSPLSTCSVHGWTEESIATYEAWISQGLAEDNDD